MTPMFHATPGAHLRRAVVDLPIVAVLSLIWKPVS